MHEPQIRVSTAAASMLWVVGVTLVVIGIYTDINGVPALGLMLGMAAMLVQIRGFIADHEECIRQAIVAGRQHAEQQAVKSIR